MDSSIFSLQTGPFKKDKGYLLRFYYYHVLQKFLQLMETEFCGIWSGSMLFANAPFMGRHA